MTINSNDHTIKPDVINGRPTPSVSSNVDRGGRLITRGCACTLINGRNRRQARWPPSAYVMVTPNYDRCLQPDRKTTGPKRNGGALRVGNEQLCHYAKCAQAICATNSSKQSGSCGAIWVGGERQQPRSWKTAMVYNNYGFEKSPMACPCTSSWAAPASA